MDPKDLTLEVLKDIREELRETRTEMKIEINGLKEEIRQTTFGSTPCLTAWSSPSFESRAR
jgi:hypothetical protein